MRGAIRIPIIVTILLILMKVAINFLGNRSADTVDSLKIRQSRARNALRGAEMKQQRLLAFCPNAGNLIEWGGRHRLRPPRPMAANGKAVRFIPKALQEIEHGITGLQHDRGPTDTIEVFASGITLRSLSNPQQVDVIDPEVGEYFLGNRKLAATAIDDD